MGFPKRSGVFPTISSKSPSLQPHSPVSSHLCPESRVPLRSQPGLLSSLSSLSRPLMSLSSFEIVHFPPCCLHLVRNQKRPRAGHFPHGVAQEGGPRGAPCHGQSWLAGGEVGERVPGTVLAPGSVGQPGPSPRPRCITMTYIHPCCWWMHSQTFKEFVPLGLAGRSQQGGFVGPGSAHCSPWKSSLACTFCGVNNESYI